MVIRNTRGTIRYCAFNMQLKLTGSKLSASHGIKQEKNLKETST